MNCYDYWKYLLEEKKVKEEIDLPIWKWTVFDNPEDAKREINVIRSILTPSLEMVGRNDEGNYVDVLFLIHCALKMRFELLWDDNVECLTDRVFPVRWPQQKWKNSILSAEKILHRSSLLEDLDIDVRLRYIARVKVEAGLPLNSLCRNQSGFFRDMKKIWNRMGLAESVLQRWGEEEFSKNPKGTFTGGIGAGLAFFQYATEILRDVDACQKKTGDSISNILIHRHHFNGPLKSFEDYLNNDNERETGINWRKLLNIKRILCLGAKPKLVTYYQISDRCCNIERLTLVNPVEKDRTWEYDKNGFLSPGRDRAGSYADASKKISIVVGKRDGYKEEQVVIDELSNDIIYFKPFLNAGGEIVKGYFETTSLPTKKSNIEFPLVVAIPEGENEIEVSLREKFFRGNFTAVCSYSVYLINNLDEYNQSGLGKLALKIRMEPLLQYVQTSINGKSIRNQSLGYPHSPATSLPLYYKDSEEWKRVPLYSNLNEIEVKKFKLGENSDAAETEVVVFPRGFRYEYQYLGENRCYNGLNVFTDYPKKTQRLNIIETRIDKNIASPELWRSLKHESDIQCDIEINDGKILTLHLPSPCPGISWVCSSEPDEKRGFPRIPLCEAAGTRLRYVSNSRIHPAKLHWIISMRDGDKLVLKRDHYIDARQLKFQDGTVLVELPNYLEKLFSATNSLMTELHIEAHMLLDGEYNRAEDRNRFAKIIVSRFDERILSENTSYFYFGVYNPMEHCSSSLNAEPSESELSKDHWIKVPAEMLPDGTLEWDGVHRIRPLHNEKDREIEIENLSALQKCLVSNNYTDVQNNLKDYFVNDDLSDEDKNFIDGYVNFCFAHHVPLCNLWLLQAVLECDWIACQIPSMNKLLKMSSYKFAFDIRLLRPEIVAKYNKNHMLDDVLKNWSERFNSKDVVKTTLFKDCKNDAGDLIGLCDCHLWCEVKGTFDNLEKNYGKFFEKFGRPWGYVEPWEKVICYIVHNVILTPEGDDFRNRRHYSNAMLCLRFLESIDENAVGSLLDYVVKWKFFKRRKYAFKTSANNRAKELDFEIDDDNFENIDDKLGCSEQEAKKNGREFAEMIFKNRQEEEQKRLEEQQKIEEERKKFLDENKNAWKNLLKKYGVDENDFVKDCCSWKDEYESLADCELEETAKSVAKKLGVWPPKPTEELWKSLLRKKGLSDKMLELRMFKFEYSYKCSRWDQLELIADRLIETAKMRKLINF